MKRKRLLKRLKGTLVFSKDDGVTPKVWEKCTLADNLEGLGYYLELHNHHIWVYDGCSLEWDFPVSGRKYKEMVEDLIEFLNVSADCGSDGSIEYCLCKEVNQEEKYVICCIY